MSIDPAALGYSERRPGSGVWYRHGGGETSYEPKVCANPGCPRQGEPFMGQRVMGARFCSQSCAASVHNVSRKTESPGYRLRHQRVQLARGNASDHACMDCGNPAWDWSQIHGTDGLDVFEHYEPRCKKCHVAYDDELRPRGEQHGNAVLTEARVRGIRASVGATQEELAEIHGVRRSTIWRILTRKAWRHVK